MKVDTCRFVIYTNKSKRTNEIKERRHIYFMSILPTANVQCTCLMINVFILYLHSIDLVNGIFVF